jgi:lactate dehydrogenase-like 2-hydroxyacid dehydrogenase
MSDRITILTPDAQYADDGEIERRESGPDVDWRIFRESSVEGIPTDALEAADALVNWHVMRIDADFIARMPNCRIIVRAGVGFDHIDLKAAGCAGIPVCNTPDYGISEVADHAIA